MTHASTPPPEEQFLPAEVPHITETRLSDRTALALLVGYLIFRQITVRIGLGALPRLLRSAPWAVPLLNNAMLSLIAVGTGLASRPTMFVITMLASVVQSLVTGLILYWAGYRFGPRLAVMAEKEGSMWAGVWNPKQVARAHNWLERRGWVAVFLGRVLEWFTTPMLLVCGASRMSLRHFLPPYVAGSVVFGGGFLWLGSKFGERWTWLPEFIERLGGWFLWVTVGLLVLLGVALLLQRVVPEPEKKAEAGDSEPTDSVD